MSILIFLLCVVGYPIIGIVSYYLSKNMYTSKAYYQHLHEMADQSNHSDISEAKKLLEKHETALDWANNSESVEANTEIISPFIGFFWPIGLPTIIVWYWACRTIIALNSRFKINLQSGPKRKIAKLAKKVEIEQAKLTGLLKELDSLETLSQHLGEEDEQLKKEIRNIVRSRRIELESQ